MTVLANGHKAVTTYYMCPNTTLCVVGWRTRGSVISQSSADWLPNRLTSLARLHIVPAQSSSVVQPRHLILPSAAMCVSPPSGVLSAYWNWQRECCSKCYPMLSHPLKGFWGVRVFNLTYCSPTSSRHLAWPFPCCRASYLLAAFSLSGAAPTYDQCRCVCQLWEAC